MGVHHGRKDTTIVVRVATPNQKLDSSRQAAGVACRQQLRRKPPPTSWSRAARAGGHRVPASRETVAAVIRGQCWSASCASRGGGRVVRRRKFVSPERGVLSSARRRGVTVKVQIFEAIRSTMASRSSAVSVGHASMTSARSGSARPAGPASGVRAGESAGSAPDSAPRGMTIPGFPDRIGGCSNPVAPTHLG